MTRYPVSISLSSYGAECVREHGQAGFVDLLADAGATHIELREELGLPEDTAGLVAAIRSRGLHCVYSSPLELWAGDGLLAVAPLTETLTHAQRCGARWLKVSLGHYGADYDLAELRAILAGSPVHLLVENDQTPQGGRIDALQRFFTAARPLALPVGMTFDIGNWQWQAQSVFDAIAQLAPFVEYVHCKGVQLASQGKLVATPPTARDLHLWEQVLQRAAPGVLRAIEFPLQGDDLLALTQEHVATLARLGQPRQANVHEVRRHG